MSAARFGGNTFIIKPVDKLLEVTRPLTGGDLAARTGPPYPAGEFGQLGQAFDRMAVSLQKRSVKLKRLVGELKKRLRQLHERTAQLEDANKELSDFTYTVSHDLRAPLRSIGGFARVLLEDFPDKLDADGRRYLRIISKDTRKMGQLIDDLRALARLGRNEMNLGPIDMAGLTQAVFAEMIGPDQKTKPRLEIGPLPPAWGDRVMLRQVLANSLANAVKFTGGQENPVIEVSSRSEGKENIYCVKNNDVGFDMRHVHKLFEVFQRLHTDEDFAGTGVGLAIVKRVIDRHGGQVWAESQPGAGAAFYFAIPKGEDV